LRKEYYFSTNILRKINGLTTERATIFQRLKIVIMKTVLYFSKFFSALLLIFYFFSSCKNYLYKPDKEKEKLTIIIQGSNTTTKELYMFNEHGGRADTFMAWSGQKIKWEIGDRSGVKSIENIIGKDTSQPTVYSEAPEKVFLSKHWKGKLKNTDREIEERYKIEWTDKNNNKYTFDPVLKVNPR
jgi:hypothetical protein